jgi:dTDP-4-dehydrorhamnose reductase
MTSDINKIFLFGSTGMLGNYILNYFSKVSKLNIKIFEIPFRISKDSLDTLEEILIDNNIDDKTCVINCIGVIPQRKDPNTNDSIYFLVNSIFPNVLWNICKKYKSKMIQPATDCVFSGKQSGGNYRENDTHDENNSYGMSKSLGEPLGCTIIRSSIIGCEVNNKKSFLEWILTSINSGKSIQGWDNHYWNGITCLEYCKIIEKIINYELFWNGVRHVYSPTKKSKYELANMVIEIFYGKDKTNMLTKYTSNDTIDKTLISIYPVLFEIPELFEQMIELKNFDDYLQ